MFKVIYGLLLAAALGGCATDTTDGIVPEQSTTPVQVQITTERMPEVSRATDEHTVKDINYYIVGKTNDQLIHAYTKSTSLSFECPSGDYDVFILANAHRDMGVKSLHELMSYTTAYKSTYTDLPMSARTAVTISPQKGGAPVILPAITVKRNLAKVSATIKVAPEAPDIAIVSVQMVNMPRATRPFVEQAAPALNANEYLNGNPVAIAALKEYVYTDYVFENRQGVVSFITSQQQKGPLNAPKFATYLLIRAQENGKALAYHIYLGLNNTTDFNVLRNTFYTLHITIQGADQVDTRLSSYVLNVTDDFETGNYGGYCVQHPSRNVHIDVVGENKAVIGGGIGITEGFTDAFSVGGAAPAAYYDIDLPNKTGRNTFTVNYSPTIITRDKNTMEYLLLLYDAGGPSFNIHVRHKFANAVHVRSTGEGSITASKALYSQATSDGTLTVLCYEEGCTLRAVAAPDYVFEGWYADAAYTQKVASNASYNYTPQSCNKSLYARFDCGQPLDAAGTANAYITPERNACYSFDATVMGNGKATTGIAPAALKGTAAHVIWETGATQGAVITEASYDNGRIVLRTGATEGNALVGLFDSKGQCIWSWHIWAVNYNPITTLQTYQNGTRWMDRNLGAVTFNHTSAAEVGLFYQWGRKDPFIGFASYGNTITRQAVTYQNGFYYAKANAPATTDADIAYAISHPTTYMQRRSGWVNTSTALRNLWGNTSSGAASLSDAGSKSIYDPCPPEWRVPDRKAWEGANLTPTGIIASYFLKVNNAYIYPMSGQFDGDAFPNSTTNSYAWSNAPTAQEATALLIRSNTIYPQNQVNTYYALPVRCVKE